MIETLPSCTVPMQPHLIPGWIRVFFAMLFLSMTYFLPFSPETRWLIFFGLCACISLFSFSFAMFMMSSLAICQGKVGFIGLTLSGVIIDDIYLVEVGLPVFICSYMLDRLKHPARHTPIWHRYSIQFLALSFFIAILALACVYETPWRERAWYQYLHVVTGFAYFVMLSSLSEKRLLQLIGFFAFWGLVYFGMAQACVLGTVMDYGQPHIVGSLYLQLEFMAGKVRACLMSPPSVTSITIGLCMWCMITFACLTQGWKRVLFGILAYIVGVGVFYTRTRSEMVAILAAAMVFAAIVTWPRRAMIRGWLVAFLLVLAIWLGAAAMDIANALNRIAMSADMSEQASLGVRIDLWKKGFYGTADNLGFGMGTGAMFAYSDDWPHAHDIYFSVLFDLGIPGMLLWGLLFAGLIRWLIHALKIEPYATQRWMALACCAGFVTELAVTGLLQDEYTTFIWSLFPGILLATLNRHLLSRDTTMAWGPAAYSPPPCA